MSKIVKFDITNKALHKTALDIRIKVFVEEQKVDYDLEIENEAESIHFLLYHKKEAIATARYRFTQKGVKLERFAILKEFRGRGYGNKLIRHVLNQARQHKKPIYLFSQDYAVGYYANWGFKIKGEPFDEANIQHYLMEYKPISSKEKALEKAICRR